MKSFLHRATTRRLFLIAIPLAVCLALIFPATASAHAILLRSDPAKDSVLKVAPQQVRMWFSEDLNPAFSTASVVNASNTDASNVNAPGHRVDNRDAHVSPSDTKEMDLTLPPNLPPAAYIVLYRTDSAEDGHILSGSFLFFVERPDGTVPTVNGNAIAGSNTLNNGNTSGLFTGQIDGPTLFNLVVITLVELGVVFWVGAQLWLIFVLRRVTKDHKEQSLANQKAQQRFEQRFSPPTLLILLLANIGVLIGQALYINDVPLTPALIGNLVTSGRFGTFWTMREIVVALALALSLYMLLFKQRPKLVNDVLPWVNLTLGLALFFAIAMSSHAAAVSKSIVVYAILVDWLHLLAAALWVGGMMYIATTYLPVIRQSPIAERARSLITLLPYYSRWALAGVAIMAVTGPFSATFHLSSWDQFITTAYGRALVVKILLVGALMITSAVHVGLLRPRLKKEYKKYAYALKRSAVATAEPDYATKLVAQQVKLREGRLAKGTHRLITVLRWEPLLGVAVLICVGLMNVFAGTLSPTAAPQQPTTGTAKPFNKIVKTSDNKFTVTLNINPNRFGPNVFTVSVVDNSTGKPAINVGVALYTTHLEMDMGTDTVNLQPDGKGHFSATGDLSMSGHWQIRIQIRTPDNTLHEATVYLSTPF